MDPAARTSEPDDIPGIGKVFVTLEEIFTERDAAAGDSSDVDWRDTDADGTFDPSDEAAIGRDSKVMNVVVREQPIERGRVIRGAWFVLGWFAVALGGIGVVVPGLPTTGFMVAAAACFAKCSPRFEQWVLDLPGVGKAVGDYRSGVGMPRRAKVIAISMMTVAIAISAGLLVDHSAVRLTIVTAGVIGVWYIVRRVPTAPQVPARTGPAPDRRPSPTEGT